MSKINNSQLTITHENMMRYDIYITRAVKKVQGKGNSASSRWHGEKMWGKLDKYNNNNNNNMASQYLYLYSTWSLTKNSRKIFVVHSKLLKKYLIFLLLLSSLQKKKATSIFWTTNFLATAKENVLGIKCVKQNSGTLILSSGIKH